MDAMSEWFKPQVIWFMVGLVLALFEFINPGIVLIFFGIGAWIVGFLCLFLDLPINVQLIIFLVSSVSLLIFLRKWFKKLFEGSRLYKVNEEEMIDDFFGKKAVVTQRIRPGNVGKVEFRGSYWDAESYETIIEGETVEIIDRKNITLIVKPI
jgi:membrane protein implicated in regulation of membrane protease activity